MTAVDAPNLTLRLAIEHSDHFGSGEQWAKAIYTPFIPRQGDEMHLVGSEITVNVKRVWWDADGAVFVDLENFIIDPSPEMVQHTSVANASSHLRPWWTDRDGDLRALLEGQGWAR